jgi:hypothetical protein
MSLTDADDENARVVNRFYVQAVKETLRAAQWSCATHRQTLVQLTETPDFGYDFYFQLPLDFVRAIYLNNTVVWDTIDDWVIEGDRILTDETDVKLVYVRFNEDANSYDDLLVNAITVNLAAKISSTLTGDTSQTGNLLQEYELALARARTSNAQETRSNEGHPLQAIVGRSDLRNRRFSSPLG